MSRVAAGLIAMLASGCFFKPDPPAATQGDGGTTTGDGRSPDDATADATTGCTVRDDFNASALECGDWGMATLQGYVGVTHNTGELRMTSTGGGSALCSSRDAVDIATGARVDVTGVVTGMYNSTSFEVVDTIASTRVGLRIEGKGIGVTPQIMLQTPAGQYGMMDYRPTDMVLWELRSEPVIFAGASTAISSTEIVLQYSSDGLMWHEVARYNVGQVKFTSTTVRLLTTFATADTTVATFDNLDACP